MLHLRHVSPPDAADVYAKLEYLNPGLSVKDRPALGMILDAEERGVLKPGATIIEPTAGNTGIGLALVARAKGYRVILVVPDGYSKEKQLLMQALGGELVSVPMADGMKGAIRKAEELVAEIPDAFIPQQFTNPANPDFHAATTGREIFEQMDGRIDAIVIGSGSGGTFTGVARYLRERLPDLQCFSVESEGSALGGGEPYPHRLEGIGSTFVPANFAADICCEIIVANDCDSFGMTKRLACEEGILSGGSGGANVWAAVQVARRLGAGRRIVTVIPDSSERYLSKGIFDATWPVLLPTFFTTERSDAIRYESHSRRTGSRSFNGCRNGSDLPDIDLCPGCPRQAQGIRICTDQEPDALGARSVHRLARGRFARGRFRVRDGSHNDAGDVAQCRRPYDRF